MLDALQLAELFRELDQRGEAAAQTWFEQADPGDGVGARHHTVPAFYLRAFADGSRLGMRQVPDGPFRRCNVADLAQRDFYTVVTDDPSGGPARLDGRLEQLLRGIEGRGAAALRRLRNPLLGTRPLPEDLRLDLLLFLSFQFVRGVRTRREQELVADLTMKMCSQVQAGRGTPPSLAEVARLRIVGHPNEYLRHLGDMAHATMSTLIDRPLTQVELDQPLLITTDEPVVAIGGPDGSGHSPECSMSKKQRRRRMRQAVRSGAEQVSELVHVRLTRHRDTGSAEEVIFPMDPRRVLVLGPRGTAQPPYIRLTGSDAREVADDVTSELIGQAYLWAVGHPGNPMLQQLTFPPPGPLVELCDGGTPLAVSFQSPPTPRHPERLRRDWPE